MRRVALLLLPLAVALGAPSALAGGEIAGAASATAAGGGALPELPKLQPIANPEPDAASLKELDRILSQITSSDDTAARSAKAAIADAQPSMVAAIRHRVQEIRGSLDRDAAPRVLEAARKAGRKSLKKEGKGKSHRSHHDDEERSKEKERKEDASDDEGDWLDFMLSEPRGKEPATWQKVVSLLAMERMLTAIGTTPAVRELIQFHAYFGDMFRVDLQRQIAKLKDRAVPALLEARQHDAKIIQRFASKELDALGRAIPGETVASNDTQVLADVLRAYGRTRDVDAVRVVLSFANSERVQLREAAREAVGAIGEPGVWQLRDQYLGLTGDKPPRSWSWDRIARELFAVYDKARLTEVYKLMDDGIAAAKAGKLVAAVEAFDKVLARAPLFERKKEMVPTYFARAEELAGDRRTEALAMMRKALRLDPKNELSRKIESEIDYLEGRISIDEGTPDRAVLEKAVELDPANDKAKAALATFEEKAVAREGKSKQYGAAGALAVLGLALLVLLVRWKPKGPSSVVAPAATAALLPPSDDPSGQPPPASAPLPPTTTPPPETPGA